MKATRNPHNLQPGQKLWYVANDRRDQHWNREVTITKIGNRWAELGGKDLRADLETLEEAGAGPAKTLGRAEREPMTNQTEIPADVLARVADAIADGFYEDEHSEVIARAALTAAGWAELFKSRNDTLAELIARIAECERLQDERNEARAALAFLMTDADGFSGVGADRHELAMDVARERGRDEPTPEDELDGFLRLIELARQAAGGEVKNQ